MRLLYTAVFCSGASALIYQVVWHNYLAILLGSHARATAVVLGVFLGGLGLGYGLFGGRSSHCPRTLLRTYGNIELVLALFALAFPLAFRLAFLSAPGLDLAFGTNSMVTDLLLASLLIGAPAILMGATLPLLTQALSDNLKEASLIHARIYGWNTVGAGVGGLLCGYILVPVLGLPFSLRVGAILNLAAAWVAFSTAKHLPEDEITKKSVSAKPFLTGFTKLSPDQLRLAAIGFFSGFYVLTLETLLIRLMGLSAGSSEYHFSLIVSIFILGLGFSPLLARRIQNFTVGHLFWNQVAVTVLLLIVYLSGDLWPYAAHRIRIPFRDIAENYYLYQTALGTALAAFLILPVGACGLTLPICFHLFKDDPKTLGHRIGLLYGANTAGSVLGGLIGGYALFYIANIDTIFKIVIAAAAATVAIAAGAFGRKRDSSAAIPAFSTGCGIAALALVWGLSASPYDKDRFIEPFRSDRPTKASYKGAVAFGKYVSRKITYIFYDDGPNTSIGIAVSRSKAGKEDSRIILVNGKSDGSTTGVDAFTTKMLGHIPALLAKNPEHACVIGFGTGLTAGVLDLYDEVRSIDIVEISPALIQNAGMFDAYNGRITRSPKVAFHEMDAFRYIRGTSRKFDIIISEPSNPWVQGIENLYSEEFFRAAREKMNEDGLFVQWLQTYGINEKTFRGMLRTMNEVFPYVTVFQLGTFDNAVVGHFEPFTVEDLDRARKRFEGNPAILRSFQSINIKGFLALPAFEILPPILTRALGAHSPIHTLERPYLSRQAAVTFFSHVFTQLVFLARSEPNYFSTVDASMFQRYIRARPPSPAQWDTLRKSFCGTRGDGGHPRLCRALTLFAAATPGAGSLNQTERSSIPPRYLEIARRFTNPLAPAKSTARLKEIDEMLGFIVKDFSPIVRLPMAQLNRRIDACIRAADPADRVRGECLVRRLILAKMMGAPEEAFGRSYGRYKAWFARIAPGFPGYDDFHIIRNDANDKILQSYLTQVIKSLRAK